MSHHVPSWEPAWHPVRQRYYFQDRVTGKSSWSRPAGCSLQLPKKPPADKDETVPNPPDNVPAGWSASFDWHNKRYFYYRNDLPTERTWLRPPPVPENHRLMARDSSTADKEKSATRTKKPQILTDKYFVQTLWDPEAFAHRIMEAVNGKDNHILREVLMEVIASNETLVKGRLRIPVPVTVPVDHATCMKALEEGKIEDYGADPKVTISTTTITEAVVFFASQDSRRVVCCINEADGVTPGGGYVSGERGTEEDMCRRIPGFHTSLKNAKEASLYPFGPCACEEDSEPQKYSDALFTAKAMLVRGAEEEGFPIYLADKRCSTSVLSISPPYSRSAGRSDLVSEDLLANSVLSIFVAPVYKEPRCTTLVIGSWGCKFNAFKDKMVELLIKGLIGELPGMPIKLGRLYHEVHFAIPEMFDENHAIYETFLKIMRRERVPVTEI